MKKLVVWNKTKRSILLAVVIALCALLTVGAVSSRVFAYESDHPYLTDGYRTYYSDYGSKAETRAAALETSEQIQEEGIILLKNESSKTGESVLPLGDSEKNVTVFGKASNSIDIRTGLRAEGFSVNRVMESFYADSTRSPQLDVSAANAQAAPGKAISETAFSNITDTMRDSYRQWNDAAIVVLTRSGGEGSDNPLFSSRYWAATEDRGAYAAKPADRWTYSDGKDIPKMNSSAHINDSYLTLSTPEAELLVEADKYFDKVIVVIASTTWLQMDFLDGDVSYYLENEKTDDRVTAAGYTAPNGRSLGIGERKVEVAAKYTGTGYETGAKKVDISACLWMGSTSPTVGRDALAKIISGEVNPSGRTVDLWASDFTTTPAYYAVPSNGFGATGSGMNSTPAGGPGGDSPSYISGGNASGGHRINYNYDPTKATGTFNNGAYTYNSLVADRNNEARWYSEGYGRNFIGPYGTTESGSVAPGLFQNSYTEGIYVGYRYYETRGYTEYETAGNEDWYNNNVVFPFGHGLSYSNFEWDIVDYTDNSGDLTGLLGSDNQGEISVKVKVTNIGGMPGKDVVQLYNSAPYISGGTEKAHVVLGEMAKTKKLWPGESQTLTLNMRVYDMASYDMDLNYDGSKGANGAQFTGDGGYQLDAGDYYIAIAKDSHNLPDGTVFDLGSSNFVIKYNAAADKRFTVDPDTLHTVENRFEDATEGLIKYGNNNNIGGGGVDDYNGQKNILSTDSTGIRPFLSRSDFDGTFPRVTRQSSLTRPVEYTDEILRGLLYAPRVGYDDDGTVTNTATYGLRRNTINPTIDDKTGSSVLPVNGNGGNAYTQADWFKNAHAGTTATAIQPGNTAASTSRYSKLDVNGNRVIVGGPNNGKTVVDTVTNASTQVEKVVLYEMTKGEYQDTDWQLFLDQLTIDEMRYLITAGGYQTAPVADLGVPATINPDGPRQIGTTGTNGAISWGDQNVLSSTWNLELAYRMGRMIGNEAMWGTSGSSNNGFYKNSHVSGWYAPGANTHRTPFSGRNGEYFSEDGILSAKMAAAETGGCRDMGVITYIKHYALNDQEPNRDSSGIITWATEQAIREIYVRAFEYALRGPSLGIMTSLGRIGDQWAGQHYNLLTEVTRGEFGFKGVVVTDGLNTWMDTNRFMRAGGDLGLAYVLPSEQRSPVHPYARTYNGTGTPTTSQTRDMYDTDYSKANKVVVEKVNSSTGNVEHYTAGSADNTKYVNIPGVDSANISGATSAVKFEEYDLDPLIQLAALRETCSHILYAVSQTSAMLNGACMDYQVTNGTATNAGETININPSLATAQITSLTASAVHAGSATGNLTGGQFTDTYSHSTMSGYEIVGVGASNGIIAPFNNAPAGLTINSSTGVISGTISADAPAGTYYFIVRGRVDGWGRKEHACSITIDKGLSLANAGTSTYAVQNTAMTAFNVATNISGTEYTVSSGSLPSGLILNSNGTITGTATTPGIYTFEITAAKDDYVGVTASYTITVVGQGVDGDTGATGATGAAGKDAEGGCNSAVTGTSITLSIILILAAGTFIICKKRKNTE